MEENLAYSFFRDRLRNTEESLVKLRKDNISLVETIGDLETQLSIQVSLKVILNHNVIWSMENFSKQSFI